MNVHPKVAASGAAGAAVVIAAFVAQQFGFSVPPEVEGAVVTLVAFAAGYIKNVKPKPKPVPPAPTIPPVKP